MANISRNTFDQLKNYVAVRLQQGVPLVDADWNELNDIVRHELYQTLDFAFTDGISVGSFALSPPSNYIPTHSVYPPLTNLFIYPGVALVSGRLLTIRAPISYIAQPWTNAGRANNDGVDVIPPLTIPTNARTDLVYLDTWEREVTSAEDNNLVDRNIGIETSVRLKREVAIRVAEGTTQLPTATAGHFFMSLALLYRPPLQQQSTPVIIQHIGPFIRLRGRQCISVFPAFLPIYTQVSESRAGLEPAWHIENYILTMSFRAYAKGNASGILPLSLPDGSRAISLMLDGETSSQIGFWLLRRDVNSVLHGFFFATSNSC